MPMESLANSAMEAAALSLASNDYGTRFTVGRHSFPSIVRVKRWNGVTHALATEPKPKAADLRTVNRYVHVWINEVSRAIELREIVTSLGPAYIKHGQALSIRSDIAMTLLEEAMVLMP
ncbi:unnamed protein product [Lactuca saligna]|uniref:Uncharacterized protein n=1 Tax=Lactuca saligna TaxID=75948 RepID=A0AA35VPI1_LACSI|nr:unnamed protein product [Lactuca saligna]